MLARDLQLTPGPREYLASGLMPVLLVVVASRSLLASSF